MRGDQRQSVPIAAPPAAVTSSLAKDMLIALAFQVSRLLLKQPLSSSQKLKLWDGFVRPYVIWRSNEFLAATIFGAQFRCSLKDVIQQRLLYFGIWEPNLTAFVSSRLKSGDCFIDVGANIGYFSVLASKLVGPLGKVVSIEASPRIYRALIRHIEVNRCDNVRPVNMAVSGSRGTLRLFTGPDWNSGATSTLASRGETFECEVPADRLDAILASDEMHKARLIKIDVEGAEAPILNTIIDGIEKFSPQCEIVAEISPAEFGHFDQTAASVIERFSAIGYHAYVLHNDYTPAAYIDRPSPTHPQRMRELPQTMTDIVFSRVDADVL